MDFTVPAVMGILNVTPDSFYDGGRYLSEVKIVERIHQIMDEGADMIDVGAYSTRPGADYVDDREEIRRLLQAVELIRKHYPEAIVSIDTFRANSFSVRLRIFFPRRKIFPFLASRFFVIMENRVDFPQPFAPIIVVILPSSIFKETFLRTLFLP